jgi:hypothetical protein
MVKDRPKRGVASIKAVRVAMAAGVSTKSSDRARSLPNLERLFTRPEAL